MPRAAPAARPRGSSAGPRRARTSAGRARSRRSGGPRRASRATNAAASSTSHRIGRSARPGKLGVAPGPVDRALRGVDVRDCRAGRALPRGSQARCARTGSGPCGGRWRPRTRPPPRAAPRSGPPARRGSRRAPGRRRARRTPWARSSSVSPSIDRGHGSSAAASPDQPVLGIESQVRAPPRVVVGERPSVAAGAGRSTIRDPNRSSRRPSPASSSSYL